MKASYHGGAWNIGQFQSVAAPANGLTLAWKDNGSNSVDRENHGSWRLNWTA